MMAKHVEVFLTILCDDTTAQAQKFQACTRIQNELGKIVGVKQVNFAGKSGVADVTALAEWEESEIPRKLAQIRMISGVKTVQGRILVTP